ncbi:MAG TPA: ATP-binding cassette domain-containing protein, partial [Phnomibacter sp.]|nr:ATP-binding cassette domain-containing protein [Phnomibacter sp.]
QSIINFVLAGSFSTSLVLLIALVVTGVFLTGVLQINQMKLNEKIQQNLFTQYAFEFAWRIPRIDMKSVDGYYMPELVNRFFDVISLQKGLGKLLLDIPVASIQIVFGLLLLSFYNPIFIFFGLLLLLILALIIRFTSPRGLDTSLTESEYKYSVAGWLQEMSRVVRSLKFSRHTGLHIEKADNYISGYLQARTSHFKILLFQYWSLVAFKVFITIGMLVLGVILLLDQELNVGQFVAAEIVILTVLNSVEKFIISLDKVYDVLTAVEKLGKVIDKPMEHNGTLELEPGLGGLHVSVRNLSFSYHDDTPLLRKISLSVKPGQLACITGPDGSGKSTLLRVLTGSYSQFEGQVLINNIPIGNYELDSLRRQVGIYFSQQEIFEGTLWENISLGDCAYSQAEIMDIAEMIGLKDFIGQLRHGFNTQLDPQGRRLNKTTTQRILFLRAIAGKPRLLLLEEPWEGMQEQDKRNFLHFLKSDINQATVIIATTDRTIAREADVVLDLGNDQPSA